MSGWMGSGTRIAGGGNRGRSMTPTGIVGVRSPVGVVIIPPDPPPTTVDVLFDWDPVPGADFYVLEIGTFPGDAGTYSAATNRPATVPLPFGVYYWRVRSVTGGVFSAPSEEQIVYVPIPPG